MENENPVATKYAFIAGSESGLAQAAIKVFPECYHIFCADIRYEEIRECGNRTLIPLDVTDASSIMAARDYIAQKTDTLDVVTCFAGIVTLGSMVELPVASMEKIMQVNFLSQYRINNLLFPFLRKAGGRIITISSEYGRLDALPIHGYYAVTKHALEVYNDSLRRELQKTGVAVTAIRPGAFRTSLQGGIEKQFESLLDSTEMYKNILTKMKFLMTGELKKAKDPSLFAKAFKKAAFAKKPKRYYNVKNSFKMRLLSALPDSLQDLIFRMFL